MKLERSKTNPVLAPSTNWWESSCVFNPAATIYEDKVVLLYRSKGNDYISRFGLAVSDNGVDFERFPNPIFEADSDNPLERLGVEDPRITKIGEEYLIFYTGASVYPLKEVKDSQAPSLSKKAPWRIRTFLTKTRDFKSFSHEELELDFDSKDSVLFPEKIKDKYFLLNRVYPNMFVASSSDLKHWDNQTKILEPDKNAWDSERVGAGAPPFKTPAGWLHFYHGVDNDHVYRLGVLVHQLDDPTKIIYRSKEPILEPEESWEKQGYVNNVVFSCGAVEMEGEYWVYYGAADKVIGLAKINKEKLLNSIQI